MPEVSVPAGADQQTKLSQTYTSLQKVHDEMLAEPGVVRAHWDYLAGALDALGARELAHREREAQRLIRDNDVTYNIYTDPGGMVRPWALDILPLLIASDEWARIEGGLIQRGELLNLFLADLYDSRSAVKKKIIPPELVYSDPGFLWPCQGVTRPDKHNLPLYAADLARTPEGALTVIADRTQAPSGAGYALENRVVLSQVLPSLFRDAHVHRLRGFFRTLRSSLASLAPYQREEPRIVLLTPGEGNEAYFEHAYLANYLGYTLVQGTDLVVRDNHVWLKTLDSLQRVDVILRRVDDEYCDPLELRRDSYLGVPGLVQAWRAGNVAIANPLGSSAIQNPALMPFLPQLAKYYLDEDLQLPSVESWWCGDPQHCQHVLANLEKLVIKPVHVPSGPRSFFGADLSAADAGVLREKIRARPHLYAAQAPIALSTAPVMMEQGSLQPRHVVLRSFLVATDDSFRVMPGGLTRVSPTPDQYMVSNQMGGISKDTWVIASEPEREERLLIPAARPFPVSRHDSEVSSRVADSLYWVGRYAERAEGLIRLLRGVQLRLSEEWLVNPAEDYCLQHLLRAVTEQSATYPGFIGEGAEQRAARPEVELLALIADVARPGSLTFTLKGLLQAARSIRDRLSSDTRRVINDIDQQFRALQSGQITHLADALDGLDNLVNALVGFSGLINENMTREQGWRFLEIGRRLERAIHTSSMLRSTMVPGGEKWSEATLLEAVLLVMDSLMTYRRRFQFGMQHGAVLELLVHDESNPRSLSFQLAKLSEHIEQLPASRTRPYRTAEQRLVLELLTAIRLADSEVLAQTDSSGARGDLRQLLNKLQTQLPKVSDVLTTAYFRPEEVPHQLVPTRPGEEE
jgi:uncharacterized circularly permuted ATP-grasp superfamily protein/uncharacterized alpha-E superfamily protein